MSATGMLPRGRHEHILRQIELHGDVRARDAARELGVSPMTIRRDLDELAGAGRLFRIHGGAIAADAPRVPHSALTAIGVVVPATVGHFPLMISGMDAISHAVRARLVLAASQYRPEVERRQVERLVDSGVRGIVMAPTMRGQDEAKLAEWVASVPVPVVFLERRLDSTALAGFDSVRTDHTRGAILAVEHLHALGHSRIGLALRGRTPTAPLVRQGHADAVERLGLGAAPVRLLPAIDVEDQDGLLDAELNRFIDDCLDGGVRAAIVHTDVEAARCLELAVDRGLKVPDDLAVVAYDDITAAFALIPLTAVTAPRRDQGGEALRMLMQRLHEPAGVSRAPRHVELLPRLSIRASCGSPAP